MATTAWDQSPGSIIERLGLNWGISRDTKVVLSGVAWVLAKASPGAHYLLCISDFDKKNRDGPRTYSLPAEQMNCLVGQG